MNYPFSRTHRCVFTDILCQYTNTGLFSNLRNVSNIRQLTYPAAHVLIFPDDTEPTDTPTRSSRTAVAVGVAVITVLVLLIIATIAGYFIVRRVKGHTKPDSSTLPSVRYQPNADINMQSGIQNAVYSSGICCHRPLPVPLLICRQID